MYHVALKALFGETTMLTISFDDIVLLPYSIDRAETHRQALQRGQELYVSDRPCRKCDAIGLRYTRGKNCYFCELNKKLSARQQAIADGEDRYIPIKPCRVCKTNSPRSVNGSRCYGCRPDGFVDGRKTATKELIANNPDMVLSRDDARLHGFTVYRTGEKCRKGHTGYRYVSTGNCIDCLLG